MPASPIPLQPTYLGFGREITRGTAATATRFIAVKPGLSVPNDKYNYVDDLGMRGSAVNEYGTAATQAWSEPQWSGDVFPDTFGNLLLGLLGEVSDTGTADSTVSTTLSATTAAGVTAITTAATFSIGHIIQIGATGNLAEIRTVTSVSGAGPYTANFTVPLANAHTSGVAVVTVTAATNPYVHTFNVLNTAPYQPPSQTLVDYNGYNARKMTGFIGDSLTVKFTATGLLEYDYKGKAFKSATVTAPTQSFSAETVKPAWIGAVTLGGSATTILQDGELVITRTATPIPTVSGVQDPYQVFAGGDVSVTGKMNLIYTDDTELTRYTGQTSTTLDIDFSNGAGAAVRQIKFHCSQIFYKDAVPVRSGKQWVELPVNFKAYGNTSDIGQSGGYSPIQVTLKNAVTNY